VAKLFVAVAGNIGVGKTELVNCLRKRLGWEPFFEPVEENPYLSDFYKDMARWAFHSQIFFLAQRCGILRQIASFPGEAVQDRTIYEDAEIFACNLQEVMGVREYQLYENLYKTLTVILPTPNLILYLQASMGTLVRQIKSRGREYEKRISREYLEQLNHRYDEWAGVFLRCPILVIQRDELDFINNQAHLEFIIAKISESLKVQE